MNCDIPSTVGQENFGVLEVPFAGSGPCGPELTGRAHKVASPRCCRLFQHGLESPTVDRVLVPTPSDQNDMQV